MGNCFRPSRASSLDRKPNTDPGERGEAFSPPPPHLCGKGRERGGGKCAAGDKEVLIYFTGRKVGPGVGCGREIKSYIG